MLDGEKIQAHKVTKPIQLLAAWLVGLIAIDLIFLETALRIDPASWERGWLVIAAVLNVPGFLLAMFILQTKFRAELQDDPHYSEYINKKTAESVTVNRSEIELEARMESLERLMASSQQQDSAARDRHIEQTEPAGLDWSQWKIALNDHLPRFAEIRAALRRAQIPVHEIFGDAHIAKSNPPSNWVVSINKAMPIEHKAELLRVLAPFGLDGFQLWRPVREADEDEDVYIGSYGVYSYTKFTSELSSLLEGSIEPADLEHYCKRNRAKTEEVRATNVGLD